MATSKTDKPATTADDLKTEQAKSKANPTSKPVEPEKAEIIDIPANEPYPTGGKK